MVGGIQAKHLWQKQEYKSLRIVEEVVNWIINWLFNGKLRVAISGRVAQGITLISLRVFFSWGFESGWVEGR